MLDVVGGRKFIFGLLLVIMGFYFTIIKLVGVSDFFKFAEVIGATYVIGNIGSAITDSISK